MEQGGLLFIFSFYDFTCQNTAIAGHRIGLGLFNVNDI